MNDKERELWVMNDEGLYHLWSLSRLSKKQFIRENRSAIDDVIVGTLHRSSAAANRTRLPEVCNHPRSELAARCLREDSFGNTVIRVQCRRCGSFGDMPIDLDPKQVDFGT